MWTDGQTAELKKLWSDGLSCSEIGQIIHRSRSAVMGRVYRLREDGEDFAVRYIQTGAPLCPQECPICSMTFMPTRRRPRRTQTCSTECGLVFRSRRNLKIKPVAMRWPEKTDDDSIPFAQRCTLMQLTNLTCRWPCGDPREAGFFFCGALTADNVAGRVYCAAHTAMSKGVAERRPGGFRLPILEAA